VFKILFQSWWLSLTWPNEGEGRNNPTDENFPCSMIKHTSESILDILSPLSYLSLGYFHVVTDISEKLINVSCKNRYKSEQTYSLLRISILQVFQTSTATCNCDIMAGD